MMWNFVGAHVSHHKKYVLHRFSKSGGWVLVWAIVVLVAFIVCKIVGL
ncbi:MAG: hypothetical protein Q8R30_00630 [bacterium]|nr:hypothetical protein [bacterium]